MSLPLDQELPGIPRSSSQSLPLGVKLDMPQFVSEDDANAFWDADLVGISGASGKPYIISKAEDPAYIRPPGRFASMVWGAPFANGGGHGLSFFPAPKAKRAEIKTRDGDELLGLGMHPTEVRLISKSSLPLSAVTHEEGMPIASRYKETKLADSDSQRRKVMEAQKKMSTESIPRGLQSLSFSALIGNPPDAFSATLGAILNQELIATHSRPCIGLLLDWNLAKPSTTVPIMHRFSLGHHVPLLDEDESYPILSEMSSTGFWDDNVLWSLTMRSPKIPVVFQKVVANPEVGHSTHPSRDEETAWVTASKANLVKALSFYMTEIRTPTLAEWVKAIDGILEDRVTLRMWGESADVFLHPQEDRILNGSARVCLIVRSPIGSSKRSAEPAVVTKLSTLDVFGRTIEKTVLHMPSSRSTRLLARKVESISRDTTMDEDE